MRLHHLLGERRPALAAWERCRQVLRDELGIAPSPATVALAEQIRSPERLSSLALRRADAALRRVEAPFVGRAAELARLRERGGGRRRPAGRRSGRRQDAPCAGGPARGVDGRRALRSDRPRGAAARRHRGAARAVRSARAAGAPRDPRRRRPERSGAPAAGALGRSRAASSFASLRRRERLAFVGCARRRHRRRPRKRRWRRGSASSTPSARPSTAWPAPEAASGSTTRNGPTSRPSP